MFKLIDKLKNPRQEYELFRRRALTVLISVGFLTLILLGRLIYLQIFQHKLYTTLARQNQLGLIPIEPNRGLIYDRNGVLLAENKPIFNLVITPALVKNIDETILRLSKIIKIDSEDLKHFERQKRLHHRFEPIPLCVKLTEEEVAKFSLEHYQFPGVSVQAKMIRHYPLGSAFASIVGYMGRINEKEQKILDPVNYSASDFIGKTGVEKYYDAQLHGTVGYQQVETNVHGQIVRILKQTQPISGKSILLTIDSNLQKLAQQALGRQKGAVVALNPSNGEILAFVSSPSFDPNLFVSGIKQSDYDALKKAPGNPLYNRALNGTYHPGSTIKPFISVGALKDNIITPAYTIHDTGEFQIDGKGRIYHNFHHHKYGKVNLLKALTVSSDIYFYNLSMQMGIERIYSILHQFNFGMPSGIDLPNENTGVLPSPEWKKKSYGISWYPGDTLNCGIGQGYFLVTPLQLAFAVSSLANWGECWRPHVLLSWQTSNIETKVEPQRLASLENIPAEILAFVRKAMQHVAKAPGGTAARFFSGAPYTVAGKTGTAQVFSLKNNERYNSKTIATRLRDNSLFITFAPIENPKIALAVIVQNSLTPAAGIARQLLDYYLIPTSPISTVISKEVMPSYSNKEPSKVQNNKASNKIFISKNSQPTNYEDEDEDEDEDEEE